MENAALSSELPCNDGILSFSRITEARAVTSRYTVQTEMRRLDWLQKLTGCPVFGKFENQQRTGSFKFRGALSRLHCLQPGVKVVAASAGNHALAVAEVAKLFQLSAAICIPSNASTVKRDRLRRYGFEVIEHGNDLEAATEMGRAIADRYNAEFISAYNDPLIIAGQGTIAFELASLFAEIDTLLIPTGGGGLAAGCAVVVRRLAPHVKLIGVQPQRFPSVRASLDSGNVTRVTPHPTFADGLAVNLERDAITFPLLQTLLDDVLLVSEDSIAAAASALLLHESQMIEPSGAVGIAAIMENPPELRRSHGIATILTGGNVPRGTLLKVLTHTAATGTVEQLTGLVSSLDEPPAAAGRSFVAGTHLTAAPAASNAVRKNLICNELAGSKALLRELADHQNDFVRYCEMTSLEPYPFIESLFRDLVEALTAALARVDQEYPMGTNSAHDLSLLLTLRGIRQILANVSAAWSWRSSSYNQAVVPHFFDLATQNSPRVNYDRYEAPATRTIERLFSQTLGIDNLPLATLATSSGMAAYQLIESYLVRHVLTPGDTILLPYYIYFEAAEQVRSLRGFNIVIEECLTENEVLAAVAKHAPKVLFLDPITNTAEMRVYDVVAMLAALQSRGLMKGGAVVLDGTMVSGALTGQCFSEHDFEVFYYESASKYLQLGYDATMGGVVVCAERLLPIMDRLRRNTGSIFYASNSGRVPVYDRALFLERMKTMSRNAYLIAAQVTREERLANQLSACFPLLESHSGRSVASTLNHCGSLVTFTFQDPALNVRESLEAFIEVILFEARKRRIPLTKGVSFGFSCPRISAAAAMAETSRPFLRLAVGDGDEDDAANLASLVIDCAIAYIARVEQLQ